MAKHDVDPVLRQLVRAVNESVQAAVPVTVTVHGTTLAGALVAESRYFSELVERNPLMSALEPASGLLGKEYAREAEAESDHHLHVRAGSIRGDAEAAEGLWRISLEAVDGWTLRASAEVDAEDRGGRSRACSAPRDYSVPALRAGYANGAADKLAAPFARTAASGHILLQQQSRPVIREVSHRRWARVPLRSSSWTVSRWRRRHTRGRSRRDGRPGPWEPARRTS